MNATTNAVPVDPDKSAAHEFLTELRTRITTQPLPYQDGVDATALKSLWEVFGQARTAIKEHPGCQKFADAVTTVLNVDLRPVTAKWDRAREEGRLDSRDGGDEFRADLRDVQRKLRKFAIELHKMAYGDEQPFEDKLAPAALPDAEFKEAVADLDFGIRLASFPHGAQEPIKQVEKELGDINTLERNDVLSRRALHDVCATEGKNAVGLALSGGGIRSATFCLGVVQVLADRSLLKDVDFLSTVSGGGYTGCFLTTRLRTKDSQTDVAGPFGPDPAPIRYLRQHAKYLAATDLKRGWSMAIATLAGMLLNWTSPLFLICVAALTAICYREGYRAWFGPEVPRPWPWLLLIAGIATIFALISYGRRLREGRIAAERSGYQLARFAAACTGLAAIWLLDSGYDEFFPANDTATWRLGHTGTVMAALVAASSAAGPAVLRFVPILETPAVRAIVLMVLLYAAALIIPLGAVALFYLACYLGSASYLATAALIGLALLSGFIAFRIVNINLTGPHRLYRDQLARTFVHASETDDQPIPLAGINPLNSAPYHLINTTLNVPSSTHEALRDRKCDFFLFSKHFCGSPATGYHPTKNWKTNTAEPDLATAMAISGAAASSQMGLGSLPTLAALLTFLNVRLGFWIQQPKHKAEQRFPGFVCLLREMTGVGMSEDQKWLNLSDGGHIENMAIYELLRRRCKYIICVDGESDPAYTFEGLMTLVRHAQIDFGVRIEPDLTDIRPSTTGTTLPRSQSHSAFCRIYYPSTPDGAPAGVGLLLYMKLSVTGNEPELIWRYRTMHPDFPHQTTLDQFFDEEQFEAYRELGAHVASGLFSRALMALEGETGDPHCISNWFRRLAANLLRPEGV